MSRHTLSVLSAAVLALHAQLAGAANPVSIQWQQSFGGFGLEGNCKAEPTSTGFIVFGGSDSEVGGSKSAPRLGMNDYWVLRLDSAGGTVWQQTHGGNRMEFTDDLLTLSNDGCILVGTTYSDPSGNKTIFGTGAWLVCLDGAGNKLWETLAGGFYASIAPLADGGFIVASQGIAYNPFRVRTALMRFGAGTNVIWYREYLGNPELRAESVQQTTDWGFIVGGSAKSPTTRGGYDYWVMRLNTSGDALWSRTFGGTTNDSLRVVRQTMDGGFLLAGDSTSGVGGDKSSPSFGNSDFWVIKIDANGNKLWESSCGGSGAEILTAADLLPDGGIVLAGVSDSGSDGNKTAPAFGGLDGWLARLDASGAKLWDQSLGGRNDDAINSIRRTADGGFIVGADSLSGVEGNKTAPRIGQTDFWVIKLGPEPPVLRWEPCCQDSDGSQWRLMLRGISNTTYRTEVSTNLLDWTAFRTNQVFDSAVEVFRDRLHSKSKEFYRARTL